MERIGEQLADSDRIVKEVGREFSLEQLDRFDEIVREIRDRAEKILGIIQGGLFVLSTNLF